LGSGRGKNRLQRQREQARSAGEHREIRPDGTGLRYLTDFRSADLRAAAGGYSPDGNWIVFRLEDHGSFGLYRIRPDGGAIHPILRLSSFKPRYIDWGPRPTP
jgi:hypothetical protein